MIRKPLLSLSLGSWLTFSVAALAQVPVIKPFIIISTFRRHNAATVFDRTNGFFLDRFVVVASTNEPCS